jgi:hypothetical protein
MEEWKNGMMEEWNDGMMEDWKNGTPIAISDLFSLICFSSAIQS